MSTSAFQPIKTPRLSTFDIETGPNNREEMLTRFEPVFEPKSDTPEPKPDARLKDPDKIADNLARVAEKQTQRDIELSTSVKDQTDAWAAEAALKAERGRVWAIGLTLNGSSAQLWHGEDEREILMGFLSAMMDVTGQGYTIAGFNILGFDLPFIRRRCIILGIPFGKFYDRTEKWKPWKFLTYDAMTDWQSGVYGDKFVALDTIARALDAGKKTGKGEDFYNLYINGETRPKALLYLENDVCIAHRVCLKMLA